MDSPVGGDERDVLETLYRGHFGDTLQGTHRARVEYDPTDLSSASVLPRCVNAHKI